MYTGIFHYVGGFLKYVAAAIIFVFSVSLSYSFFSLIAPANMPWFVWAALGLTEVGLLIWIAVFRMQRHHDAHKAIAFVMVLVCLAAVLYTDAMELANLFHLTTIVSSLYYYALIVLLLIHFGAFALDEFIKEGEKWARQQGNLIPTYAQYGNVIPQNGGYHNRPLALKNQPKDRDFSQISLGQTAAQPALPAPTNQPEQEPQEELMTLGQVAHEVKEKVKSGASSLMKRGSHSKKRTKLEPVHAPGNQNGTTDESTSTSSKGEFDADDMDESVIPVAETGE